MSKTSTAGKVAAGVGVAALAAGAAAAYYLTGPGAKKHQKQAKAWAKKAKSELVKEVAKMGEFSKTAYEQAASEVLSQYKKAKDIDPKELAAFGKELKAHWNVISKHAKQLAMAKPKTGKKKSKR